MDLTKRIIDDVCRKQVSTLEKLCVNAFENHFGISIDDVDLREIERIVVGSDPIESYTFKYRGEPFLYVQVPGDIDINTDPQGVKLSMTYKYKELW